MVSAEEVHLWYVFSDRVRDPGVLDRYAAMLTPEERARRDRFVFEKDRHQFVVTRGVLRTLIARDLGIDPAACTFVVDAHGRPSLAPGIGDGTLVFNLSHTAGLIAVGFARGREIGVDAEDVERAAVDADLPRRFFSPLEVEALESLPPDARTARFFDYWTLKEAYIKARGLGLSLPLDGFSMLLDGGPPRIRFAASIQDDPMTWQFAQYRPGPRHRLALAVRRRGADLTIQCHEAQPAAL